MGRSARAIRVARRSVARTLRPLVLDSGVPAPLGRLSAALAGREAAFEGANAAARPPRDDGRCPLTGFRMFVAPAALSVRRGLRMVEHLFDLFHQIFR